VLDPEVAYWCEMAEADAYRDLVAATSELPDDRTGAAMSEPGDGVAFCLGVVDQGFWNRAVGLGVARPATEADVDDLIAFFDAHRRSVSAVQLAPHAVPEGLIGWLETRGYARSRTWSKMWHDLSDLPTATTDLRIEQVGPEWADEFTRLWLDAFGVPAELGSIASASVGRDGWTHYLGFDGDVPVTIGATRIVDGVAWLGFGGTVPSHRGRGGQSAMFARRLRDARDAGCRLAITETGTETPEMPNASYRNMVRAGFSLAYDRPNWVRQI